MAATVSWRMGAALLATAALAGCAEGGPQTCKIDRVIDLPLVAGARMPSIEASLDGQNVVMLIDTGAATSIIARSAADHFNLRPGPEGGQVVLRGVGGSVFAPLVTVPHLILGHGIARNIELPVAGDLGGPVQGLPVLGVFGADFLSEYDVDINLPEHHFTMYRLQSCGSNMQPLAMPAFNVPFELTDTKVMLDLKLNDTKLTGFLDSGASHTMVPLDLARRAGASEVATATDRAVKSSGIDENKVDTRVHVFGSLQIGDETMRNFRFGVADIDVDNMILGDDFLRFNEVWISYPLRKLFIRPFTGSALVHQLS